jgi:glycosyltransferase involved in cell wall biosynthesis
MDEGKYTIALFDEGSFEKIYGGQLARYQLFNGLNQKKFNPIFISSKRNNYFNNCNTQTYCIPGLNNNVNEAKFDNLYENYRGVVSLFYAAIVSIFTLVNTIKKLKIDIIFPNDNYSRFISSFAKLFVRIKIATYISDDYKSSITEKIVSNIIILFSDVVFVPSMYLYKKYTNRFILNHNIIYNKPGIERLPNAENERLYGPLVNPNVYNLCIIGNIIPLKGHSVLFDALEILSNYDFNCFVIGSGEQGEINKLKDKLSRKKIKDRIIFEGYLMFPFQILEMCDFLVSASSREANSRVLQESYLCKKPVIATDVGGQTELVKDGITGFLVKPNSPTSIAEGLRKMFEMDKKDICNMGSHGKHMIKAKYDYSNSVRRVEDCIRDLFI